MINGEKESEGRVFSLSLSLSDYCAQHKAEPSSFSVSFRNVLFPTTLSPPSSLDYILLYQFLHSSSVLISADNTRLGYNNTPAQNTM